MKLAKIGNAFSDWLAGPRDALARVRDALAEKRHEHAEAEAERVRLVNLRAPREEVLARLDAEVGALGAQWADGLGARLVTGLSGALDFGADGVVRGVIHHAGLANLVGPLELPALCAITPTLVRDGLAKLIAAAEYEAGPAMAARARLIAEVDERIASIEQQHANLVDAAAELGLTLEDLPENRAKKIQATRAAERQRLEELHARARRPGNPADRMQAENELHEIELRKP